MNKEKIISYLKCDITNYVWFFPPLLFYLIISILIVFISIESCTNKEDKVKHIDMSIEIDTIHKIQDKVYINDSVFIISKSKHWSSKETNLPIGIVYSLDCANSGSKDSDQSDNYITVKKLDGSLSITRDVDVDLYLNLKIGDTIK